jgi:hypothetical protein
VISNRDQVGVLANALAFCCLSNRSKKKKQLHRAQATNVSGCCLLSQNHNMMLLDEPTNHLDIEAIDSLAEAIKGFKVRGVKGSCVAVCEVYGSLFMQAHYHGSHSSGCRSSIDLGRLLPRRAEPLWSWRTCLHVTYPPPS